MTKSNTTLWWSLCKSSWCILVSKGWYWWCLLFEDCLASKFSKIMTRSFASFPMLPGSVTSAHPPLAAWPCDLSRCSLQKVHRSEGSWAKCVTEICCNGACHVWQTLNLYKPKKSLSGQKMPLRKMILWDQRVLRSEVAGRFKEKYDLIDCLDTRTQRSLMSVLVGLWPIAT